MSQIKIVQKLKTLQSSKYVHWKMKKSKDEIKKKVYLCTVYFGANEKNAEEGIIRF